jgi:histidine triad (HIT) family protein
MSKDCIFCKIITGEIPANIVYEDSKVLAMKDIEPISPGHTVILCKRHHEFIRDLPETERGYIFEKATELAEKMVKDRKAEGYNIIMCSSEAAQSAVPHRPHLHIVPRWKDDGLLIDPRG